MENMIFRSSCAADINTMTRIAAEGKALLKSLNISQWQKGTYPDRAVFEQDLKDGIGYVALFNNQVAAVCAVTFCEEPSYKNLQKGEWKTEGDVKYATIHRLAVGSDFRRKGISTFVFKSVIELAKKYNAVSIRVDTHPDNLTMQHTLEKLGFEKCGELLLADGDEAGDLRLGYEFVL